MPNISFERPVFVFAAFLAPLVLGLGKRFVRDAFSLSLSLGPPDGASFATPFKASFFVNFIRTIMITGASVLLFAAAGPVFISNSYVYLDRGADILFVVDCSPSMAGLDIGGKRRFDVSRSLINEFSVGRPADAIGLVAVGNDAALLIPPTMDRHSLLSRLESLRIGELGDGTALGMGLSVAALHLRNSTASKKAVVLITDGENNAGSINPETAAAAFVPQNISLYVIAVGAAGETPIDYVDPFSNVRRTGTFDSHFNSEELMKTALAGNGLFISAPSIDSLAEAFSHVNKAEITINRSGTRGNKTPFHEPLAIAGVVLISCGILLKKLLLGAFL
jgi:Ca-activated chloride channel family protein